MAFMTTITRAIFFLPRDQKLLEKFIATHDLTEWDRRDTEHHTIQYVKEEVMDIKELDKF